MSPQKQLEAFANDIYLVIKNRFFDGITEEDGKTYILQVISWTNMFIEELEQELDPATNKPVDWWFLRQSGFGLGTATEGAASISLATQLNSSINRLITDDQRYVQIQQDGTTVSNWAVVNASQITNRTDRVVEDMCAMVGTNLVFSRAFKDTEAGGTIIGDVMVKMPLLSTNNVKALSIVKPTLLLKLGVAKNSTLPDIVQGGLSPSYAQKYSSLLDGAISRSRSSSRAAEVNRQDFSNIGGVGI